ncbi:amidase [Natronomonas marina]|uniref:amidase n=1 Tax=Natronomonas marina TaxID=2961939 RepID=UPI0020C97C9C|nr:amidase [Natronomonas marina]
MSLHYASAVDVADGVRSGEYDPVDVVETFLERIDDRNDVTNAFVTVLREDARERAAAVRERIEAGEDLPLAGVPVAMKDLHESKAGVRHTMGLEPLSDDVAETTSVTIERLEAAGAVVVGTTNTPELGYSVRTDNELQGPTGTPFDPERNAGGSSGGSAAALADGCCALATGSDVGGSLRNPASCCGVVSVKPSFGLVPRGSRVNGYRGHTPVRVLGPMARDVESLALMLDVIAGPDAIDPFSVPTPTTYRPAAADPPTPDELTLAYSPDLDVFAVEESVRAAVEGTLSDLESAGATVEEVSIDAPDSGDLTHAYSLAVTTFFATAVSELEAERDVDLLADYGEEIPSGLRTFVSMGRSHDAADYATADFPRTDLYHAVEEALSGYDALVCPTLATPPLTHDEPIPPQIDGEPTGGVPTAWTLAWPFNMTGHPVVNVPAETVDGLPVGMQVVGPTFSEPRLLGVAAAVEATSGWEYPEA